ncbi:MAG TPA: protein kinase [Terriglobales bacterium]
MSLQNGERLGPYEILGALGAGGMGEVYKARDTRLQREVAVKVLPLGREEDAGALRRFEQEARTLAALNHPNLLTVFDTGTTAQGALYLVTELLDGATLRERMAAGKLPQRTAVDYGMQMSRGLAAAHDKGIIHRDLKPENIFCTRDGRIKILDFGLAKLTAETGAEDKTVAESGTAAGVVLGTVGYMAPEQARGQAADARSDIFSLGCVIYEMLAGRRAFRGESAADVISAILREDPPELTASDTPVAPALQRLVRHCMEKEPRQRFQSVSDVAYSLEDLGSASSVASGAMAAVATPSRSGRRWGFASAGTLGLVAVAGLSWWWARRPVAAPVFQRITYEQGIVSNAHFMPDGQTVIGTGVWNNQPPSLFSARLDATGTEPVNSPAQRVVAVAPGEAAVILNAKHLSGFAQVGTLARMPLSGGAPKPMLADVEDATYNPRRGDLAITRFDRATSQYVLEYPIGHELYHAAWISSPRFSRDGRRIGFLEHEGLGDDQGTVDVVDLSGQVKVLTPHFASVQGVGWSPNGSELWFTAADTTILRSLRAVTMSGRERTLLAAPASLHLQDVAADGRVLVTSESTRLATSLVTAGEPEPRSLTVLDWAYGSEMTPDGQLIAIGDQDAGVNYSTYLRKADGSPPVRLGDGNPLAISSNGQWVVSVVPANLQLWLLPTGTGEPRQLTRGKIKFDFERAAFTADGQALLAQGQEAGHPLRTFRVSLQDGATRPATAEGVVGWILTPDGKALLARQLGSGVYSAYPLGGGEPRAVVGLQKGDWPLRYTADGRSLFVAHANGPTIDDVLRIDSASGNRTLLYTARPGDSAGVSGVGVHDIAADGKRYLVGYEQDLFTLYLVSGVK